MDQLSQRECRLSEEIDIDFEKSQEQMRQDEEEYNWFVDPEEFKKAITPKKPTYFWKWYILIILYVWHKYQLRSCQERD